MQHGVALQILLVTYEPTRPFLLLAVTLSGSIRNVHVDEAKCEYVGTVAAELAFVV